MQKVKKPPHSSIIIITTIIVVVIVVFTLCHSITSAACPNHCSGTNLQHLVINQHAPSGAHDRQSIPMTNRVIILGD